jgi:hypothetical protein
MNYWQATRSSLAKSAGAQYLSMAADVEAELKKAGWKP